MNHSRPFCISIGLSLLLSICCCFGQVATPKAAPKAANDAKQEQPKKKSSLTGRLSKLFVGKTGGDKFFYAPFKHVPKTPKDYKLKFEDVHFKSADGTKLFGWFIPAKNGETKAKATIVFSHGNGGSVSYHLAFVNRFVNDGYNVFLYDYRGYGHSEGKPEKVGVIADAVAALKYTESRPIKNPIFSVGHSLGGAKSCAAICQYQPKQLKGIVFLSTFSSYRKMGVKMVGQAASTVISDTYNPVDLVKKMPKIPLLVMHCTHDNIVPFSHGKAIYEAANQPKKFIISKKGKHNDILHVNDGANHKLMIQWMEQTLANEQALKK